jgi:hypothetical protein
VLYVFFVAIFLNQEVSNQQALKEILPQRAQRAQRFFHYVLSVFFVAIFP